MSEYACPDCGIEPWDEDGFYYVEGGDRIDCTEFVEGESKLRAKPPEGKKAYPTYSNFQTNNWAAMEFGGNPRDWEETHCCPQCEKEFSFTNSDY